MAWNGLFGWMWDRSNRQDARDLMAEYGFTSPAQRQQLQANQNIYAAPQPQAAPVDPQAALMQQIQGGLGMQQAPAPIQAPSSIVPASTMPTSIPLEMQMRLATIPGFEGLATGAQSQQGALERQMQGQQFSLENMTAAEKANLAEQQRQWANLSPLQAAQLDIQENQLLNNLDVQRAQMKDLENNYGLNLKRLGIDERRLGLDSARLNLERMRLSSETERAKKQDLATQLTLRDRMAAEETRAAQFDTTLGMFNDLMDHPGLEAATGKSSKLPTLPGSKAADFEAKFKQLQGAQFVDLIGSLKSGGGGTGLGSLTETEGKKLLEAVNAAKLSQSAEDFRRNMNDARQIVIDAKQRQNKYRLAPQEGDQRPPLRGLLVGG